MSKSLAGKIVLIVGASGGIGSACVQRFLDEGSQVIATGSRSVSGLRKRFTCDCLHCDVSDPTSVEALAESIAARYGGLDVVVNNAGIGITRKRLHEVDVAEWDRLMTVNLRGTFLVMKFTLPLLIKTQGAALINIASTASYRATAGAATYSASKGGVLQLTRAAALEYVDERVRVNAICPGTVRTPLLDRHDPSFIEQLEARIPMKRLAKAEEIASLAAFLASDDASYITGQGYVIDGGRFAG